MDEASMKAHFAAVLIALFFIALTVKSLSGSYVYVCFVLDLKKLIFFSVDLKKLIFSTLEKVPPTIGTRYGNHTVAFVAVQLSWGLSGA